MKNRKNSNDSTNSYQVIHPLDDVAEEKRAPHTSIGLMRMTPMVRFSLMALRVYLFLMIGLVFYRVLEIAGAFGQH